MRLILKFSINSELQHDAINKYTIQGFIYNLLHNTDFEHYHDLKGFKYFSYSNIFPVSPFKPGEIKNLIISSPWPEFIKTLRDSLQKKSVHRLGKYEIEIKELKIFNVDLTRRFISSTPIVLFKDNENNIYHSLDKTADFSFFMDRIKENALKKYNSYYGDNYYFEGNIFDRFEYGREVAVRIKKADKMFIVIGTLWKNLEKFNMDNKRFYRFIMDAGLGEKNSLGFGMLNPVG